MVVVGWLVVFLRGDLFISLINITSPIHCPSKYEIRQSSHKITLWVPGSKSLFLFYFFSFLALLYLKVSLNRELQYFLKDLNSESRLSLF